MKVLDGGSGVATGTTMPLGDLGLPVRGEDGLLIVFWKAR